MADFYTGLANTAEKLLNDKGQQITVRRSVRTFDPVTSETILTQEGFQTLSGAVFKGDKGSYDQLLEEEKIKGQTKSVILSTVGSTYVPVIMDECIFDDCNWLIYGVSKLSPANIDVIYKLGVMFLSCVEVATTYYIRPDGFRYLRPDAVSYYTRPTF